jgi:hypothetical protein
MRAQEQMAALVLLQLDQQERCPTALHVINSYKPHTFAIAIRTRLGLVIFIVIAIIDDLLDPRVIESWGWRKDYAPVHGLLWSTRGPIEVLTRVRRPGIGICPRRIRNGSKLTHCQTIVCNALPERLSVRCSVLQATRRGRSKPLRCWRSRDRREDNAMATSNVG